MVCAKNVLIASVIVSFLALIGLLVALLFAKGCCIQSKLSNIGQICALLFQGSAMALTLILALKTYNQNKKVENVKALLDVRKVLASPDNKRIHKFIGEHKERQQSDNDKDVEDDKCQDKDNIDDKEFNEFWENNKYEIYDYLGTLEVVNIFLNEGVIAQSDFMEQYSYRLRNITQCLPLLHKIEEQQNTKPGWTNLIELMKISDGQYTYPKTLTNQNNNNYEN